MKISLYCFLLLFVCSISVEAQVNISGCSSEDCTNSKIERFLGANIIYPSDLTETVNSEVEILWNISEDGRTESVDVNGDIPKSLMLETKKTALAIHDNGMSWDVSKKSVKSLIYRFNIPVSSDEQVEVEYPLFPGCENMGGDMNQLKSCADTKLLRYLYTNLNYPAQARRNSVQGTVMIKFMVNEDGSVSDPEVTKSLGSGCDEAALTVVENMINQDIRWTPGKKDGKIVAMPFTLPVRFKLH